MEYYVAADYRKDGFHITVKRPVLTPEEYERRMKRIHDSAARLLRDIYFKDQRKENAQ